MRFLCIFGFHKYKLIRLKDILSRCEHTFECQVCGKIKKWWIENGEPKEQ